MKSYQIVADNLKKLYELTGLRNARLCALAEEKGLKLSTSTLSRFLNGGNSTVETLDSLVEAIKMCQGYEWISHSHLLTPNIFAENDDKNAKINPETLTKFYFNLFIELDEIGWASLNRDVSMQSIVDFSIHKFKKFGFEVAESDRKKAALRSHA